MSSYSKILIRKASGESEFFDVAKLKHSLLRAGADKKSSDSIASEVETSLYEGISTKKIYDMAFRMLRKHDRKYAVLYKLKQALFELGPTGFPFEHFVGEIFRKRGFHIEVGKIIEGRCITHEMDVIATNKTEQIFIECKYSKDQGKHVSIQVPLYVQSRVEDIIGKRREMSAFSNFSFSAGLVSNNRFSFDSIEYSKCVGIMLLGWDYPQGNGLKEIIEQENVFPITVLEGLTREQKEVLMQQGIVTCEQLISNMDRVAGFNISKRILAGLQQELEDICNH